MPEIYRSKEIDIRREAIGYTIVGPVREVLLSLREAEALTEAVQAKRDEWFRRVRSKSHPHIVAHERKAAARDGTRAVLVFDEHAGESRLYYEDEPNAHSPHADAARAWFEKYPKDRPWEHAEMGDSWILTIQGKDFMSIFDRYGVFRYVTSDGQPTCIDPKNTCITDGRSIIDP